MAERRPVILTVPIDAVGDTVALPEAIKLRWAPLSRSALREGAVRAAALRDAANRAYSELGGRRTMVCWPCIASITYTEAFNPPQRPPYRRYANPIMHPDLTPPTTNSCTITNHRRGGVPQTVAHVWQRLGAAQQRRLPQLQHAQQMDNLAVISLARVAVTMMLRTKQSSPPACWTI